MEKRLYLVSTRYTLLNALRLEYGFLKGEEPTSVLIIFDKDNVLEQLTTTFEIQKLFKGVYILPFINSWPKIRLLIAALFPKAFFKKYIHIVLKDYRLIFSQNILYASLYRKAFPKSVINLIEDGLSTYTDLNINSKFRSKAILMAHKFIFFGNLIPSINTIYLHEPKLYKGESKVERFPEVDLDAFIRLFNYGSLSKQSLSKYDYYYLGTPLNTIHNLLFPIPKELDNFRLEVSDLLGKLTNTLSSSSSVYKLHPFETIQDYHDKLPLYEGEKIWEIECFTLEDDSFLISFFSTATISPKLLYDKEPRVIYLYKLLPNYNFFGADEFVNNIRNLYRNKDRVFVPETLNEFEKVLQY